LISVISLVGMCLACSGAGAFILRLLGVWQDRDLFDRSSLAFAIGIGVFGWLLFWVGIAGYLNLQFIWGFSLVLIAGNWFLTGRGNCSSLNIMPENYTWWLIALIALAVGADALEALAPPVDADSLAYHFVLPKKFAATGIVTHIPIAFSGAIPLLIHMTYTAAYLLGGELTLTGWTFLTGWGGAILLYSFARQWLSLNWALMLVLLYQTLPTMIYGAGSGQIEARLVMFTLIAAIGLVESRQQNSIPAIILVGLGSGFFAASKLTGLFFIIAAATAILFSNGSRFKNILVFGLIAAATGSQWYLWNLIHTGDPLFPMLFKISEYLGISNSQFWDAAFNSSLKNYLAIRAQPIDAFHAFFTFPVWATLFPHGQFAAGRIGLGPLFILCLPLSFIGIWYARHKLLKHDFLPLIILLVLFYLLWINFGGIPKVRHLLPVLPILIFCLIVSARKGAAQKYFRPLVLAVIFSISINFAALAFFAKPNIQYQFLDKSRDDFLLENVKSYRAAIELNKLSDVTGVYLYDRQIQYYITAPSFFSAPYAQKLIYGRPGKVLPQRFFNQLIKNEISHILSRSIARKNPPATIESAIVALHQRGCLNLVNSFKFSHFNSRTIKTLWNTTAELNIWQINSSCKI
jgi:hypothetical protein